MNQKQILDLIQIKINYFEDLRQKANSIGWLELATRHKDSIELLTNLKEEIETAESDKE